MTALNSRILMLLAAAGSAGVLIAAFGFQYLGGLAPCALCLWQRWPHAIAALAGGLSLVTAPLAALVGIASGLVGAGIAVFHTGVERRWWDGPATCSGGGDIGALTPEQLLAQIEAAPIVRCDEIPWELFGLSMANYNIAISLGLAALWGLALVKARAA